MSGDHEEAEFEEYHRSGQAARERRERIATAVLAGSMADQSVRCDDEYDARRCARWAVMMADGLIAVLDAEAADDD